MSKPISLRIASPELAARVENLSAVHGLSMNLTVQMLLGYAFNEIDKQGKEFTPVIVFDTEEKQ